MSDAISPENIKETLKQLKIHLRDNVRPAIHWHTLRDRIVFGKRYWKFVLCWAFLFNVQMQVITKLYYPSLFKWFHRLLTTYLRDTTPSNAAAVARNMNITEPDIVGLLADKGNRRAAKLSSDVLGLWHACIMFGISVYAWKKFKRKVYPHLMYGYLYKFERIELLFLELSLAYYSIDEYSLIYYRNPNLVMHFHHFLAIASTALCYMGRIGSPGHNFFIITAECSTVWLLLSNVLRGVFKKLSLVCQAYGVRDEKHFIKHFPHLLRLKKLHHLLFGLFAFAFLYMRCYHWTRKIPAVLKHFIQDSPGMDFPVNASYAFVAIVWLIIFGSWFWAFKLFRQFYAKMKELL